MTALSIRASVVAEGRHAARVEGPLPLTVYGRVSEALPVRLATGVDSLTLGDWPRLRGTYEDVLVMVSRPYSTAAGHPGKAEVEVEARVVPDAGAIDVTSFTDVMIEVRTDNTYDSGTTHVNELIGISSEVAWQGDGFYAYSAEDTFVIRLNPSTLELGEWYGRTRYMSIGSNVILRQLGGHALALDEWDENSLIYRIGGLATCGVLTHVFQSHASDWNEDPYHWLTGHTCRAGEASYSRSGVYLQLYRRR